MLKLCNLIIKPIKFGCSNFNLTIPCNRSNKSKFAFPQVGLDPDATLHHPGSKPAFYGLLAAHRVVEHFIEDAMNQLGDKGVYGSFLHKHNIVPYRDYTNFTLDNDAYFVSNIYKMTPLIVQTASLADFSIQTFVTPQYVLQKPITFDNPNQFNVPPPQRVSHLLCISTSKQVLRTLFTGQNNFLGH